LPQFKSTYNGFQYFDNEKITIASGPQYTLAPAYKGSAGEYIITPKNVQYVFPVTYNTIYVPGTLYVNPKGKGAKKIKPFLECVKYVPDDPSGFDYIAYFGYTNDNSTTLCVPPGQDNYFIAAPGSYLEAPPKLFFPGTHRFTIHFNGTKLTWTIATFDINQKTSVASVASSTSNRCGGNNITTSIMAAPQDSQDEERSMPEKTLIYPNPATNIVIIDAINTAIKAQDIKVLDIYGRTIAPKYIRSISDHSLELDISGWTQGTYFIRAKVGNTYKTFIVLKRGTQ
jgi:hypothetical protein